jgi:uncharacterized protein YndB with AHSA1/START domain
VDAKTPTIGKATYETPSEREIRITRVVDAPRPLVFEVWTDPKHMRQWLLGPEGWTTGMKGGMDVSFARFDALLAKLGGGR